ncbi:DUF5690 family protein [Flammeovirgaceae bacterium SG7u.111]|nr:DUF5690 family protein [Flammeovirgaceae bacterium SG7u.132]WPO37922.1 DUF5690 family protein [Flammeovirgaceae bacterium SG7u.111]
MLTSKALKQFLQGSNTVIFVIFGWCVAFITYTSTYAFRKPITAAIFEDMEFWGIDYKILVITSQVIGYTLSKFIGIKIVSELQPANRAMLILKLIGAACLSLLLFAIVPPPYNIAFMILNGLPLGMVWGVVFTYLEGRTTTELLAAGLSTTQIFSSGVVKSVGKTMTIAYGVPEIWMPFLTGIIFMVPLVLGVWLLNHIPLPSPKDIEQRTLRKPMNKTERKKFVSTFFTGVILLLAVYILLTVYRDFRDNFSADIWNALGYGDDAMIFTQTETPIFIGMLIIIALMMKIKNNMLAFQINLGLILIGGLMIGGFTFAFQSQIISPFLWLTGVGFGLYLGYVPFNIMLFERMIAAFKYVSTVGFLITTADAFGYLGSLTLMIIKNFGSDNLSYLNLMIYLSYAVFAVSLVGMCWSIFYFYHKYRSKMQMNVSLQGQLG